MIFKRKSGDDNNDKKILQLLLLIMNLKYAALRTLCKKEELMQLVKKLI